LAIAVVLVPAAHTANLWANPPAPVKLVVHPAALELHGASDRHRLLVTAVTSEGQQTDVTRKAVFASKQPDVAEVSAEGECRPRSDGSASLLVTFGKLSATVPVTVTGAKQPQPPSFVGGVLPLFTRLGCNQGACHGKGAGQNGFRLSLRGYAPEWDHAWLTREFDNRRINRTDPEASLLLRKPLGVAPHEGGKLFDRGSRGYQLLLDWIRAGTPGPQKDDLEVQTLEILPGNLTLRVGQEQQFLVRAKSRNGRWREVTWLSQFASNDTAMAAVDAGGKVTILRPGETALRASFRGQIAVVVLTVPYEQPVKPELFAPRNNFIDEHVFGKLAALKIEPSELSSDTEFLRRVFLDTIGVLPMPDEVRSFLADKRPDKRARLIDALLERPEFVDFWTLQLGDLFQNRKESDHDVRGTKGVRSFHEWLRRQVARNRPWDELAREVLTARGKVTENPAVGYFIVTVGEHRHAETSPVVASVAQALLGTRIGCAQCHNHPLEKYTQDDYYHFAGYFSRLKLKRKDPKAGVTTLLVSHPDANQNKNPIGVVQPRTGKFLGPQPLDRSPSNLKPGDDPRVALAAWMTDPKNEYFSGAMVNRTWKHFFGVGLVEPVDDLRASNPPSNPGLWKALIKEFVSHKFDRKHLIHVILNSRAYQLTSATRPGNERDTRFFSHYQARRLQAEVLLDAIAASTGEPDTFPGYPVGVRAVQVPDPGLNSYFLSLFGRSERITACACERSSEVTMPQLLHLQSGSSVVQKIAAPTGRLSKLLRTQKDDAKVIEELFLATLGRLPTGAQRAAVRDALAEGDGREMVFRDLFWALLNSQEFAFIH
jgi:hypothetical protein